MDAGDETTSGCKHNEGHESWRTPATGETDDAGMRLEPGSGGTGGLKWDDVAAGLRGLEDPAYWYAQAVFCQDNVFTMRLLDYLTMSAYRIIKQSGHQAKKP